MKSPRAKQHETKNEASPSQQRVEPRPVSQAQLRRLLLVLALGGAVPLAFAEEAPAQTPPPPVVKAGPDGFSLQSADGQFELKIRGYVQADGRFFLSEQDKVLPSTFLVRRVRPIVEGTLFGRFDYRIMTDFGSGTVTLQDAVAAARIFDKALVLQTGKFKPPVGLERLQSATHLVFVERALPTNLVPNRDVGVQLQGQLWGGVLSYAAGVFDGVADGASVDVDIEDNKDTVARLYAQPFKRAPFRGLQGLGIGIAGSQGELRGTPSSPQVPVFKTTGQQVFFSYRQGSGYSDTVVGRGFHSRIAPQGYYAWGPVGVLAEYVRSEQRVGLGDQAARLNFFSWQVATSYVIGGDASYEGVKPRTTLSKASTGLGALEVAARYHELRIPEQAFPVYADPKKSAQRARAVGMDVNWYLNRAAKASVLFERTGFVGGAPNGASRPVELALIGRFQLAW